MRFTWRKANFWESGDICNMSMINCRVWMDFCRRFHAGRKWYKYCERWRSLLFYCLSSSGNPGAVSRAGRNGATKVFKHWRKSPWVRTLTGPFPNSQVNTGSWLGTKKCIVLLCPIGEQIFVSSYTWIREFVHLVTVARFIHQAFLTRQRNYRWVEKCFGCYQREQLNLHWENSVSDGSQCIVNNRKFKMRRHRTRNKKKQ